MSEVPPELSVIIPAYNEEARLGPTLEAVARRLAKDGLKAEIVVVDDGSRDDTRGIARRFEPPEGVALLLVENGRNRGKGASVRRGAEVARGRYVLVTDADASSSIDDWTKLKAALDQGHDVAIGSRALRDSAVEIHQPWYREGMGKAFNLIVRGLGLSAFHDTQCGFKLFRGEAARQVLTRLTLDRFGFDVEALLIARRRGYTTAEIPVRWRNSPASRVRPLRDATRMFFDLLLIKLKDVMGRYRKA